MAEAEILRLNKEAMDRLREGDTNEALILLNATQEILKGISTDSFLWGVTFNNLGCYFKKTKDLSAALMNFLKGLEIVSKKPNDVLSISGTLLNISSVYSEMNQHEKALLNAVKANGLLLNTNDKDINILTSLIVSYHCVGIEYEYLGKKHEAFKTFKAGFELAKERLNKSHRLTVSLKKSLEKCQSFKSSVVFYPTKSRNMHTLKTRSHSSNPHNRIKFPQVARRIITPTKDLYKLKSPENPVKTVPNNHVNAINSLVREIEDSFERKPRKYVFKKRQGCLIEGGEEVVEPGRFNLIGYGCITPSSNLQIIPESTNEDNHEGNSMKKVTRRIKAEIIE